MLRRFIFFSGLFLTSLLSAGQSPNPIRSLPKEYRSRSLEQALSTLIAANVVYTGNQVEYKAGQSVVLQPGFETRAGSVFWAHTGIISQEASTEDEQNALSVDVYPNPFEQHTTIRYVLTKSARTSLRVLDVEGRFVHQLVDNQYQEAGRYVFQWQADQLAAGVYICVLETEGHRLSQRIIRR